MYTCGTWDYDVPRFTPEELRNRIPCFLMYSRVIFCGVRVSKKVTGADTRACSLGTRSSKCHRYGLKKGDVMSTDFDCRSVWLSGGCVWLQAMSPGFVKSDGLLFLFLIN